MISRTLCSMVARRCSYHSCHPINSISVATHTFKVTSRNFHNQAHTRAKQVLPARNINWKKNSGNVPWWGCTVGLGVSVAAAILLQKELESGGLVPTVNAASPPTSEPDTGLGLRSKYNFVADVVEKVSPAVVFIKNSTTFTEGCGSGFVVSSDGLIVTNAHVVQSAAHGKVYVELNNGKAYNGKIQVVDSSSDLALVKINDTNLPTIKLGKSGSLRPGEWVVAVGSPMSLSNTVTSGIVSSTARKGSELGLPNGMDYIQTDAPITFGNSGGPLINLDGEAVGVNSMKVTQGISFAIPSDYVAEFLTRAENFKKEKSKTLSSKRPYIGIATITLSPHIAAQLRSRVDMIRLDIDRGIFVVDVTPGSPAQQAGLQKFDTIMKVDGKVVDNYQSLVSSIVDKAAVRFTVYREGAIRDLHITPHVIT